MSAYKVVNPEGITFAPSGPMSERSLTYGETFTLDDEHDFIVGSQIAESHVEKLDLNSAKTEKSKKDKPE